MHEVHETPAVCAVALAVLVMGCAAEGSADLGRRSSRIVGGAPDLNHRYVVEVGSATRAFCSGTVISRHTVLTAGHCIGSATTVYFGPTFAGATAIDVIEQVRDPM